MPKEHLELLVCPDCKENLKKIDIRNTIIGFYCPRCKIVYPVKDDIPIILAKEVRNYNLEYTLIKEIKNRLSNNSFSELHKYINRTLNLIMLKKTMSTWEWEDEEFWSKKYVQERKTGIQKNWNDRIWQREVLIKELTNQLSLKGKTVLDIGCGEGQNFKFLLSKYCDENSLYIATDISLEGLRLNRSRNTHKNSLYILCSADYELPFPDNTIDILCYFGILHHTKNKSNNIEKDKRLIRKNGCIILAETIDRPTLLLPSVMPKDETSVHEGHISKKDLLTQLNKGFEVFFVKEEGTPFFTAMMTLFRNSMLNSKEFFYLFLNLDILFVKTLSHIIPFFRAGEILLLARRRDISLET